MKLTELDPGFFRYDMRIESRQRIVGPQDTWHERGCPTEEVIGPVQYKVPVTALAEAQCIFFQCPKCIHLDGPGAGHYCEVTFADRGVADDQGTHNTKGQPTRWQVSGTNFDDLTTKPSILLEGGCNWHGYITNGDAE
jgi:hypothetical protein